MSNCVPLGIDKTFKKGMNFTNLVPNYNKVSLKVRKHEHNFAIEANKRWIFKNVEPEYKSMVLHCSVAAHSFWRGRKEIKKSSVLAIAIFI